MSMLIEQAIFTSAATRQGDGYHIVASSPGISKVDLQALSLWCPSHDGLLEESGGASSVNFHGLPSGAYCVSRTLPAGAEYSGRRGLRIHTHALLAPPSIVARFANNAFSLLRAAVATGAMDVGETIPKHLNALQFPGRSAVTDRALLAQLACDFGAQRMGWLVEAALSSPAIGLVAGPVTERVLAGLISCLPVAKRTELTFSTGLKHSTQRPFRCTVIANDPPGQRHLERQFGMTVIDPQSWQPPTDMPEQPWAATVASLFRPGKLSELERELENATPPEPSYQQLSEPAALPVTEATSDKLETLHVAVYEAIAGIGTSIDEVTSLWSQLRRELDEQHVEPSREEYVRYALTLWNDFSNNGMASPQRAAVALDVIDALSEANDPVILR